MKLLPDKSVDLFVCDLPYGQLAPGQGGKLNPEKYGKGRVSMAEKGCAWDIKIDLPAFWEQVERLARNEHTPVLHFCNTKFGIELINSKPLWFRYDLVWNKDRGVSFLQANKQPMRSHEMIYVFSKKGAFYNRVDEDAPGKKKENSNPETPYSGRIYSNLHRSTGADEGKKCSLSIVTVRKVGTHKQGHPTEKPLELYKWLIERYSLPGGVVLDATAGSFNSVLAAQQLGRNGIGIEKDEGFFNAARDRLEPRNEIIPAPLEDAV
jgi:site-specific DNA-methyltransferase (adenine-specific)